MARGGYRPNSGAKKKEVRGVTTTVYMLESDKILLRQHYGSISAALRFAAQVASAEKSAQVNTPPGVFI